MIDEVERWRVERLGVIGPWYRLWWYDYGLYSGGETEGWHLMGTFHWLTDGEPADVVAVLQADQQ